VRIPHVGNPIKPPNVSSPSKIPNPRNINTIVPIQKSIRFFIIIFPAFFALVKPVSTIANPACIKNTRAAPIKYQIPKTSLIISFIISSSFLLFFCTALFDNF
jgi:hypothetical protein